MISQKVVDLIQAVSTKRSNFRAKPATDDGVHEGSRAETIRQMCSRNSQIIQGFLKSEKFDPEELCD
jgi:hypothetical protein